MSTSVDKNNLNDQTGYLFGISRDYRTGKLLPFRMDVFYASKQFTLQSQHIQYYASGENRIKQGDIHFSVNYIDVSLLAGIFSIDKPKLKLYAGPSISVPVYDYTEYQYSHKELLDTSHQQVDYHEIYDEPDPIFPFFSFHVSLLYEINKFILESR